MSPLKAHMTLGTVKFHRKHFESLDGLRGVAAAIVLVAHAASMFSKEHDPIFWKKYLAVYFFFMLSGFVIASSYENRLRTGFSIAKFGILRVIRLYPLVILGAFTAGSLLWTLNPTPPDAMQVIKGTVLAALCAPYFGSSFGMRSFPINPPEWSLFFEIIGYAFFALVIPRLRNAHLFAMCALCVAGFTMVTAQYAVDDAPFRMRIFGSLGSFLVGVWLFRYWSQRPAAVRPIPIPVLGIALIGLCALPNAVPPLLDVMIIFTVFPAIILSAAACRRKSSPVVKTLGDLSYPVYILHWGMVQAVADTILPVIGRGPSIAIASCLAVAFAWVALKYYDEPLRAALVSRVNLSWKSPSSAATSSLS